MEKIDFIVFILTIILSYLIFFHYPRFIDHQHLARRINSLNMTDLKGQENSSNLFAPFLQQVLTFFNKLNLIELKTLEYQLHRSGWKNQQAVPIFLFIKILCIAVLICVLTGIFLFKEIKLDPIRLSFLIILAILLGIRLPDYALDFFINRRHKILERGVSNMIDILVICTEAGLGLDSALERVANELRAINKPLAEEIELTVIELSFSANRRNALINLSQRLNIKSVTTLIPIFIQSEQYGTTLAKTLKDLSNDIRQGNILEAESKAARLPAILTLPLIIFILPCLFIILLAPVILQIKM